MTHNLIDRLHDRGVRVVVVSGYPALPNSIKKASAILHMPVCGRELVEILRNVMGEPREQR